MVSCGSGFSRHDKVSKGAKKTAPGGKLPPEAKRALGAPCPGYSLSGCVPSLKEPVLSRVVSADFFAGSSCFSVVSTDDLRGP